MNRVMTGEDFYMREYLYISQNKTQPVELWATWGYGNILSSKKLQINTIALYLFIIDSIFDKLILLILLSARKVKQPGANTN